MRNRNTGEFIDNIRWWFWNGPNFPGLMSRDSFSAVADKALLPDDRSKLRMLMITSGFQTQSKNSAKEAQRLLGLMNSYLIESNETQELVLSSIDAHPVDALKAYINVLEYWGLDYSWCDVVNAFSEPCVLISYKGVPKLTLNNSDIRFVQGRPFRFKVEGKGYSLSYDEEDRSMGLKWRNRNEDGPKFLNSAIESL